MLARHLGREPRDEKYKGTCNDYIGETLNQTTALPTTRTLFSCIHSATGNLQGELRIVVVSDGVGMMPMQRCPAALAERELEVLIIGGGAFGAAAARDAALRGLDTALIERGDFGAATSAECFKMVHGGIRYLQHADLLRLRASCHERSALLRIAPHLVHPLPIAIPTYGHGRRGRELLAAGARVYDFLTLDRNLGIRDRQRRIRSSHVLSRERTLELFSHLEAGELSGAVVFEDGQMHNPARLVLAFVKAAANTGAKCCNYIEALELLWDGNAVRGVRARDRLTGELIEIRARLILNAAGPWADYLHRDARFGPWRRLPFSRDACFVIDRAPASEYGIAVQGLSRDKDAVLGRTTRHLFAVPWRDKTLLGVWHRLFPDVPDAAHVEPGEIEAWIAELNTVHPALALSPSEVTFAHCGLVPFGETATETELSFGKASRIVDHQAVHGVSGLVSLTGIRFTTARGDAARALELLLRQRSLHTRRPPTDRLRLPGGDIESFEAFEAQALRNRPPSLDESTLRGVLRNHGTGYGAVLRFLEPAPPALKNLPGAAMLLAEIRYAVKFEMAVTLEDIVMRRTDLAAGKHPGRRALHVAAQATAHALSWSPRHMHDELAAVERTLARHLARASADSDVPAVEGDGAMLADLTAECSAGRPSLRLVKTRELSAPSA